VAAFFLLVALILLWYSRRPMNLNSLPPQVRWQYEQYQVTMADWESMGSETSKFYRKKLSPGSTEYKNMESFFYGYLEALDKIQLTEVYAIYNPTLIMSFINQRNILATRIQHAPDIFAKKTWKMGDAAKENIYELYEARCLRTGWNENTLAPIMLCCHGTDYAVAMAICSTGFAALSSLDAGWYGTGVYFTTYAMYSVPYFANRKDPALILAFVTPGNVFPTTESHTGPKSLLGSVLKAGYNSHYIGLKANGCVPNYDSEELDSLPFLYDEIVVGQEPQITPVYVLRIDTKNMSTMAANWDNWTARRQGKKSKEEREGKKVKRKSSMWSPPPKSENSRKSGIWVVGDTDKVKEVNHRK